MAPAPSFGSKPGATSSDARTVARDWHEREERSKKKGLHSTVYMSNSDKYAGEWMNNLRHGRGAHFYKKSGMVYEGQWAYDKRNGFGVLSVPCAPRPKAKKASPEEIEDDPSFDVSVALSKTGKESPAKDAMQSDSLRKVYAGDWQDDMRSGVGTAYYPDDSLYEGEWRANQRCGWGTMLYADGSRYDGEWKADQRHGQGILLLANHDRYEGIFVNDMKEGPGKFFYKVKRQVYEGEWSADMPKCGTLRDIDTKTAAGLAAASSKGLKSKLPMLELANPTEVLAARKEEIMQERVQRLLMQHGSPSTPEERGNSAEEEFLP